jgi:hypothetical protein
VSPQNIIALLFSFFTIEKAFVLASKRCNEKALAYLNKKRFSALSLRHTRTLYIEYCLLRMYLEMRLNVASNPGRIFSNIWLSKKFNYDEKNFLTKYALGVLWMARRRQGDCLLRIRQELVIREDFVRPDFRRKFPSRDIFVDTMG